MNDDRVVRVVVSGTATDEWDWVCTCFALVAGIPVVLLVLGCLFP
jgi:hypothetical protein